MQRLKGGKRADVDAILRQLTGRQHRAQLPAIVNKRDISLTQLLVINHHGDMISPRLLAAGFGEVVQIGGLLLRVSKLQRRRVKIVVGQRPAQRTETKHHRRHRRQRHRPPGGNGQQGILPHPGCCYSFHAGAVR